MVIMGSPFFSVMYFNLVFRVSRAFYFPTAADAEVIIIPFIWVGAKETHIFFLPEDKFLTDKIRDLKRTVPVSFQLLTAVYGIC